MRINEEDIIFLTENIESAENLIESDDKEALLEEIDGFMTEQGYALPDYTELNEIGRRAEKIYDKIYWG